MDGAAETSAMKSRTELRFCEASLQRELRIERGVVAMRRVVLLKCFWPHGVSDVEEWILERFSIEGREVGVSRLEGS